MAATAAMAPRWRKVGARPGPADAVICGGSATRRPVSAARGSARPIPGRTGGRARRRRASGRSLSVAASTAQAARSASCSRVRDGRLRASGLVNAREQGAAHALLGFGELRNGCRVAQACGQRAEVSSLSSCVAASGCPAVTCGRQSLDVGNQLEQVGAVHRRIGEAGLCPVPVGVQAAATAGDDRAFLAGYGIAQPVPAGGRRCRDAARPRRGEWSKTFSPVAGAPSNATFSESTCS